jgi:hypothetical protein
MVLRFQEGAGLSCHATALIEAERAAGVNQGAH